MLASQAELVQRLRGDFLAGSRFADQQHGRGRRRDAADLVVHRLHRGRVAEHQTEAAHAAKLAAQGADFRFQVAGARQAREDGLHALHVDRFDEVVRRAHLERADSRFHRCVAGYHDHLDARARVEILEKIDARAVGQLEIGEHDVRRLPHELNACLAQIAGGGRRQSVFADDRG